MPARVIRQKHSNRKRSLRTRKSKTRSQRAGAIYSFDLNDKIGGQAAYKSLYKTTDSDCPMGGVNDPDLGNSFYDPSKPRSGGGRKRMSHKRSNKSKKNLSKRSNKKNARHTKSRKH
jgi:hypothetical protein